MRMICVLSPSGQLLGHINLAECGNLRSHITVENIQRPKASIPPAVERGENEITIQQCVLPVCEIKFQQQGQQDSFVYILGENLPDWFWDSYAAAEFTL